MKKNVFLLLIICLVGFTFGSCQKNENSIIEDEVVLTNSDTQVDEAITEIDQIVSEALMEDGTTDSISIVGSCPVITKDLKSNPQVMTIDFGSSCTGKDGKIRSGKIIVTSTSFKANPSVRTKTFDNYTVNDRSVEGSISLSVLKDTAAHKRTFTTQEDLTVTLPEEAGSLHRISDLTKVEQYNVKSDPTDDIILHWGLVEVTRSNGTGYTKTISAENPVMIKKSCNEKVSGIVNFVNKNNKSWTVDYGNGDCDGVANMTKNGQTKEIPAK